MTIKIGFSNLDERNIFAREMREHLEQVASKHRDIQLIVRDNQHSTRRAIANANEFARLGVDVAIIYHIDERGGIQVTIPLRDNRIPVIGVEFRLPFASFISIDNKLAGAMSGREGGKWICEHWSGQVDKFLILTDQRVISAHRERFISALTSLKAETSLAEIDPLWMDSGTDMYVTKERFASLLQTWESQHRIAIITMGDVVSEGVIEVARSVGREQDICVMSFDGTTWADEEFKKPNSRLIVSPKFNLDDYCHQMLELAKSLVNKELVPQNTFIKPVLFTRKQENTLNGC